MEMQRDHLGEDGIGDCAQPHAGSAMVVDHELEVLPVGGPPGPLLDEFGQGIAVQRPVEACGVHRRGLPDGAQQAREANREDFVDRFGVLGRLEVFGQENDAVADIPSAASRRGGPDDQDDQTLQELESRLRTCRGPWCRCRRR